MIRFSISASSPGRTARDEKTAQPEWKDIVKGGEIQNIRYRNYVG
jgi:hypothetical protein